MNSWLLYLLKACFCILPFYAIYLLFLRRLTFFRWNRLFLLGSLVLSFIIPLLTLPVLIPVGGHIPVVTTVLTSEITKITTPLPDRTTVTVSSFSWMRAIQWIYLAGAMIMLIRFLLSLWQVYKMIRCGQIERSGRYRIVSGENILVNASFFRFIFLKQQLSAGEKQSILIHEGIHARKGHSADILLVEILKVICWFHPAIYHYRHLLQRAHEFEVDNEMTGRVDKKEYAALLLGLQSPRQLALTNLFSASELKERIRMLFTEKSVRIQKAWYLFLIPALLIAGLSCGIRNDQMPAFSSAPAQSPFNRTLKSTRSLGPDPLVIINGKEYPSSILTKINPRELKMTHTDLPPVNGEYLRKYGEKVKDGFVELKTFDSSFLITNKYQQEDINIENAIPDSQFFTRVTLKNDDGTSYDKVIIHQASGGSCSVTTSKGGRVAYFLNNQLKTETQIANLDKSIQRAVVTRRAGGVKFLLAYLRGKAGDAEATIELFTKGFPMSSVFEMNHRQDTASLQKALKEGNISISVVKKK